MLSSDGPQPGSAAVLTDEMWMRILAVSPPSALGRISRVSRRFAQLASSEAVWQCQLKRHYTATKFGYPTYREAFRVRWIWEQSLWLGVKSFKGYPYVTNDPIRLEPSSSPITTLCLAGLSNRPLLAAGRQDGTLCLWNLSECEDQSPPICILDGHTASILALKAYLRDGVPHCVTSSADHSLKVWNLSSQTLAASLDEHTDKITGLEIVEQGRPYAISSSCDKTIRVYDLVSLQLVQTFEEAEPVRHLATVSIGESVGIISMAMYGELSDYVMGTTGQAQVGLRMLNGEEVSALSCRLPKSAPIYRMISFMDATKIPCAILYGQGRCFYFRFDAQPTQRQTHGFPIDLRLRYLNPIYGSEHMLATLRHVSRKGKQYALAHFTFDRNRQGQLNAATQTEGVTRRHGERDRPSSCMPLQVTRLQTVKLFGCEHVWAEQAEKSGDEILDETSPIHSQRCFHPPGPRYRSWKIGIRSVGRGTGLADIRSPAHEYFGSLQYSRTDARIDRPIKVGIRLGVFEKTHLLVAEKFTGWTLAAAVDDKGNVAVYIDPRCQADFRRWHQLAKFVVSTVQPVFGLAKQAVGDKSAGDLEMS